MFYAVYIPTKPQSNINFSIGLRENIWGVKENYKSSIKGIENDDLIAFVHGITWIEDKEAMPPGFSRVSKEKISEFRGAVKKIIICKISKSYYFSESTVWKDDIYPHRFNFHIIKEFSANILFGIEFFNPDFVEAVRSSACKHGSLIPCIKIKKIDDIYSKNNEIIENIDDEFLVLEGKPLLKLHTYRERNIDLIKKKKESVFRFSGKLLCEICNFDFEIEYGELGKGYIECHHNNPLSLNVGVIQTKLDDLSLLCSNCHKMIHRRKPWISVEELRKIYERNEQIKS